MVYYHRSGDWEYDLQVYSQLCDRVWNAGRSAEREALLGALCGIYSYWDTRFRARRLFLGSNGRIPTGLETQVADYISPPGVFEDYVEFTPLQLLEFFA